MLKWAVTKRSESQQLIDPITGELNLHATNNVLNRATIISRKSTSRHSLGALQQQQQQLQQSPSSSSSSTTTNIQRTTVNTNHIREFNRRKSLGALQYSSVTSSPSSTSAVTTSTTTTTNTSTILTSSPASLRVAIKRKLKHGKENIIECTPHPITSRTTRLRRSSIGNAAEQHEKPQQPLRDVGNNKNIVSKKRTYSCSSLTTIITPKSKQQQRIRQQQSIEKNIFKRQLKNVQETPSPPAITDNINYATTLPTLDLEYSPCHGKAGPFLGLRGLTVGDTYFNNPCYFRDDIIAQPVTKRLKFSPGPGSAASTKSTTTSENIMSSTLNRRLSSLRFSKMSFKKSDIKHQKFPSTLLSGSTTTSLSLTNINQILNSSSPENSLSSSAMNDTELDRMIEAILESARKERIDYDPHKQNQRRRNTTQQNRNTYPSNNNNNNDNYNYNVNDNNNNNKNDRLSTYTAAVDPASDLNKFYNNFHMSPNKILSVGETTIIVNDQFVNEREVKTPDNDDKEIVKRKEDDDEGDDDDDDAYSKFEQKENEDKLDALLQLNTSQCFLRRQRAVRRKNKIDCTKSLLDRRLSSSCRKRSTYFARDAKLSSSPKTPSTCTNTSYFRKSIDHLFAMNTPSLIEPHIKPRQPIEAINQQLINQLVTTNHTIIDNKESSSILSKKSNENNSGIESNGIQACSTPTTGAICNTASTSKTINNDTNFNVNTQSIIESNLSNTRRCLTYTTTRTTTNNNMNDDYDDADDIIVQDVLYDNDDDDDDDENEDDNNLPPNFFEETLEKRKSLATSTVTTNTGLFNSNNNIYARNRFSAAASTAPIQITTSIVNGSLDLAIFAKNNKIHIHVIRCRDLFRSNGDTINAYVKVALLPNNKANGFQRTAVQRDSIRPFFDHRFIFDLNDDYLTKCIQLSVWHRDRENKRSEFLGCMSIPVKNIINKEVNGSYKLQPQSCLSAPIESISTTMGDNSHSSVDETISLDEFIVGGGAQVGGGTANSNGTFGSCFGIGNNNNNSNSYATINNHHSTIQLSRKAIHQRDADENLFLRFLELDPVLDQTTSGTTTTTSGNTTTTNITSVFSSSSTGINTSKNGDRKQSTVNLLTQPPKSSAQLGRTPFTITKKLHRTPDKGFGFSIVWTHPPRIEKIEPGLSADKVGIYPGDYVIFVEKQNIVTMPEIDILNLIRSQGNTLLLEIFRRNPTTNNLASNRGSNTNVDTLGNNNNGNNGNNCNNGYNNNINNGGGGNRSICTTNGIKSRVPSLTISNTNDDNQYPAQPQQQQQQQSQQHSSRHQMSSCLMVGRPSTACSNMSNSIETSKRRLNLPQVTFSKESIAGQHILDDPQKRYLYQLISKEQHFVNALQFGIQRFTTALQDRRDIISINDHKTLFQNIEEILRLSEDILDQLVQDDQDPHINFASRVYLSKSTAFCAAYKKYCNGIKRADCVLVNKSRNTNSDFMNFITEPQVPKKRPDLITFIHRPLQHFREVLKLILMITSHCRPDSEEYRNFTKIISEYQATYRQITVGEGLMEPIGEGRLLLTLQDLESRLVFTKCKPFVLATKGRQWIFGGDLSRVEGRSIKPYWTLLFSDILLFAKVSRDRVLFITEEPLPLSNVIDSCFNVRKRSSEFRITFDPNAKTVESPTVHCAPDLTRTPRRNQRKRIIVLRAPSPELKAVWQNLLQRQIFLVNTTLGSTVSSPLDSPDILQTFVPLCEVSAAATSMASIKLSSGESINLRTLNCSNSNNNNNNQLQSHHQQQQQVRPLRLFSSTNSSNNTSSSYQLSSMSSTYFTNKNSLASLYGPTAASSLYNFSSFENLVNNSKSLTAIPETISELPELITSSGGNVNTNNNNNYDDKRNYNNNSNNNNNNSIANKNNNTTKNIGSKHSKLISVNDSNTNKKSRIIRVFNLSSVGRSFIDDSDEPDEEEDGDDDIFEEDFSINTDVNDNNINHYNKKSNISHCNCHADKIEINLDDSQSELQTPDTPTTPNISSSSSNRFSETFSNDFVKMSTESPVTSAMVSPCLEIPRLDISNTDYDDGDDDDDDNNNDDETNPVTTKNLNRNHIIPKNIDNNLMNVNNQGVIDGTFCGSWDILELDLDFHDVNYDPSYGRDVEEYIFYGDDDPFGLLPCRPTQPDSLDL